MENTEDFEKVMRAWPYPWPEILELLQREREDALRRAESTAERNHAEQKYKNALDGIKSKAGS